MGKLISVNVSLPKEVNYKGKKVNTGIYKEPVSGRVKVNRLNLQGDGQADLNAHGGEMRAIYVYSHDNYLPWANELVRSDFRFGQFGENFTVEGMLDHEIHIGDRFRIGTALFEVSQPRVPCYKLAMKMDVPNFYSKILSSGRLGFYFRVLEEGEVEAGNEIIPVLVHRDKGMTISEVNDLMYFDTRNYESFRKAVSFKALSPGWRTTFLERLEHEEREEQLLKAYSTFIVTKIVDESDSIRSFYLHPKRGNLTSYVAGQFLPIWLEIPGQYLTIHRTYTISNAPGNTFYRLSIKREDAPPNVPDGYPGVASNYFHDKVKKGTEIMAAAPRGTFVLKQNEQTPVVLISAGVGITPMMSMLESLAGRASTRKVYFIHGARNGRQHAFGKRVRELAKKWDNVDVFIAYSKPLSTDVLNDDYDQNGRLDIDKIKKFLKPNREASYYICGPKSFMIDILMGLKEWGVPLDQLFFEQFSSSSTPINLNQLLGKNNYSLGNGSVSSKVYFLDAGLETEWEEGYENILEFAESKGLSPKFSCRAGVCQTCITTLVSGTITYDPKPLIWPKEGKILICCSKPKGPLELQL